jgi:type I restriction enzyme, S subunit
VQSEPPRTVLLGEVADVFTGATPSRTRAAYWGGSIPWVTTGDIDFNTIIKAKEHITERAIQETSAKVFNEGTLLMAMYGQGATRGKVARLGLNAATNQACAAIVPKHGIVSVEYLFQVLAHSYDLVRSMSNSGGQANLSTGIVRQIPIPLPTPVRQAEIAAALACWDRVLNLETELLRLARISRHDLRSSLTRPKKSWRQMAIRHFASAISATNHAAAALPVLNRPGFRGGRLV